MIENVGNLVCPALFDLGERAKVLVASVTEGDDKPYKYPHMFRAASLVVLSKLDLAPHVPVRARSVLRRGRRSQSACARAAALGDLGRRSRCVVRLAR